MKLLEAYPRGKLLSLRLNTTFTRKSLGNETRRILSALGICINSIIIRLVIVYRPPSQSTKCSEGQFLSDFSDFLQILVVTSGKLLIVGDLNIHTDVATNSTAIKLQSILQSFGLSQHVHGPTHLDGHTLDLIIARDSDKVITDCLVSDLICDHFAVHTFVKAHRPPRPRKVITYRELNRINDDRFLTDLLALPLFTSPAAEINDLLGQYNYSVITV